MITLLMSSISKVIIGSLLGKVGVFDPHPCLASDSWLGAFIVSRHLCHGSQPPCLGCGLTTRNFKLGPIATPFPSKCLRS